MSERLVRPGPGRSLGEWPPGVNAPMTLSPLALPTNGGEEGRWWEQFLKFWPNPPPWHLRIFEGAEITLAASASRSTVVSYALPKGYTGLWYSWAQNTANAGDFANITWALLINGRPVPGFESIISQVSSLLVPRWVLAPVPPSSNLVVIASNASAVQILRVGSLIDGWCWPVELYQ